MLKSQHGNEQEKKESQKSLKQVANFGLTSEADWIHFYLLFETEPLDVTLVLLWFEIFHLFYIPVLHNESILTFG